VTTSRRSWFVFTDKVYARVLVDAFNPIQSARYDLYKRAKLRKETLRRIVNHALSQSVPASVVTTINGFTKVFAGEIIEKARTVQEEWAEAFDRAAYEEFLREEAAAAEAQAATAAESQPSSTQTNSQSATTTATATQSTNTTNGLKQESPDTPRIAATIASPSTERANSNTFWEEFTSAAAGEDSCPAPSQTIQESSTQREFTFPPNPHRGQLLPSHLRESVRRYKREGEGGRAGISGLSMMNLGVRGANTWNVGVGGRRLFR
jgi:transcription initiation factor TFIID subunit 11